MAVPSEGGRRRVGKSEVELSSLKPMRTDELVVELLLTVPCNCGRKLLSQLRSKPLSKGLLQTTLRREEKHDLDGKNECGFEGSRLKTGDWEQEEEESI